MGARLQCLILFLLRNELGFAERDRAGGPVVRLFGVSAFFLGVLALAFLAIRRGQNIPTRWPDYVMMFVGLAGAIMGLAVVFLRFN